MSIIDKLEDNIHSFYRKLLDKKQNKNTEKTLNCDSFKKITNDIKIIINECQSNNINTVTKISSYIIYKGVNVKKFTIKGINDNSTIDEIELIVESWL